MSKFTLKLSMLSLMGTMFFSADAELLLKIDEASLGNTPMPVMENVDYDVLGQEVTVTAKHPLICHAIDNVSYVSNVMANIISPNGPSDQNYTNTTAGTVGLLNDFDYDLVNKTITLVSENLNKALCLTSERHDVIFKSGYSDGEWVIDYPNHFEYQNVMESQEEGNQFTMGVEYVNDTGAPVLIDLIEYWPVNTGLDVYVNTNGVNCSVLNALDQVIGGCNINFGELGKYKDITLEPGEKIRTSNNFIIHPGSNEDHDLYLMAAVFKKVTTIQSVGGGQSFQSVEYIESQIKVDPQSP